MASNTEVEREIASLERRLVEARATKPVHDTSGAYQATLLEIEDEIAEKRRLLAEFGDEGPAE